LNYLHGKGIAISDLKLSNIMLKAHSHETNDYSIKISDCGSTQYFCTENGFEKLEDFVNDTTFKAPELVNNKYIKLASSDVWALGIITYKLFAGIDKLPYKKCVKLCSKGHVLESFKSVPEGYEGTPICDKCRNNVDLE